MSCGSSYVLSSLICQQTSFHNEHNHRVSLLYGISCGLEATMDEKRLCHIHHICGKDCGLKYAFEGQELTHTFYYKYDRLWQFLWLIACVFVYVERDLSWLQSSFHSLHTYILSLLLDSDTLIFRLFDTGNRW